MEVTNQEILEGQIGLRELMKVKLPIWVWDAAASAITELKSYVEDYQQVSNALCKAHNVSLVQNPNGGRAYQQMDALKADEYQKELDALDMDAEGSEAKAAELKAILDDTVAKSQALWTDFMSKLEELKKIKKKVRIDPIKLPKNVASTCDKCHHNMNKPLEIEGSTYMQIRPFVTIS